MTEMRRRDNDLRQIYNGCITRRCLPDVVSVVWPAAAERQPRARSARRGCCRPYISNVKLGRNVRQDDAWSHLLCFHLTRCLRTLRARRARRALVRAMLCSKSRCGARKAIMRWYCGLVVHGDTRGRPDPRARASYWFDNENLVKR